MQVSIVIPLKVAKQEFMPIKFIKKKTTCLHMPSLLFNKEMNFKLKNITLLMLESINYICT